MHTHLLNIFSMACSIASICSLLIGAYLFDAGVLTTKAQLFLLPSIAIICAAILLVVAAFTSGDSNVHY